MSAIMKPVSFKRSTAYSPSHQFAGKHAVTPIREHDSNESPLKQIFIDLRKTSLHIKRKILKPNGEPVLSKDNLTFVNLPFKSLRRS